ncbi:MAG: hypothetical protein JSR85_00550 [Proteobacteria bacterium]|nr:hypothetical protein [Pseudomonadota bacterium]
MKTFKLTICALIPLSLLLIGCGRKLPPESPEGTKDIPKHYYPKPE